MPGWPISVPGQILTSPVIADLDEDGDLEIVVWTLYSDVYVFHHDGSGVYSADGLLKNLPGIAFGTPAVGDIDGNGHLDIVVPGGGSDSLYVWDRAGNYLAPFPVFIQPGHLQYSPVLGDLFGDERLEICFYADSSDLLYCVDADGIINWTQYLYDLADVEGSPIIADVTGDDCPEIICAYKSGIAILDSTGMILPGYPDLRHDTKLPVVADADDIAGLEVIAGSADWNIYAYRSDGTQAPGYPIMLGSGLAASPAVYDIDGDGLLELMMGGYDYKFHVFDLNSSLWVWPRFRYDPYNTGTYGSSYLPGIHSDDRGNEQYICRLVATPNPFKQTISITWARNSVSEIAEMKIYDVTGRLVKSMHLDVQDHSSPVVWNAKDDCGREIAAGVYIIRLETEDTSVTEKVIKIH
jgi:hypothetical protein